MIEADSLENPKASWLERAPEMLDANHDDFVPNAPLVITAVFTARREPEIE